MTCLTDEGDITVSMRATILNEIHTVAASQQKTLAPLMDDLSLIDSGLDSLCFAILVARLEGPYRSGSAWRGSDGAIS